MVIRIYCVITGICTLGTTFTKLQSHISQNFSCKKHLGCSVGDILYKESQEKLCGSDPQILGQHSYIFAFFLFAALLSPCFCCMTLAFLLLWHLVLLSSIWHSVCCFLTVSPALYSQIKRLLPFFSLVS